MPSAVTYCNIDSRVHSLRALSVFDTRTGRAVREALEQIAARRTSPTELLSTSRVTSLEPRLRVAVDELKASGWPIERIVGRLKELAIEVGAAPRDARWANSANNDPVLAEIVRIAVDPHFQGSG